MTASSRKRSVPDGRWVGTAPAPWEQKVLSLIAEQYAIPIDLLSQFLRLEPKLTVELMKEFHRRKWVTVKRFFVNDEPWVWLLTAGLDYSDTGFARKDPALSKLPHYRALAEIRLSLEKQHPDGEWISNRALWPNKSERGHVPNALFRVKKASGEIATWAIEVEYSEKSTKRYRSIVSHRCKHYDRALFYCTPELARKFEQIPEFEYAKVHISETLKDISEIENFQWRMSPAHSPKADARRKKIEDWEGRVVRLIAEQYAIPGDQFARLLGFEPQVAQRIANHLDAAGFIDQGKGPPNEPPWLWVTPVGARLAETGLAPNVPSLFGLRELRCMNEAYLYVRELDPTGQWWSKAMLLRGNRDAVAPTGVVRQGDKEYAVEIEPGLRVRESLVNKYERRYAEHRSERRGVLVLCRTDKVELFEELKKEHDWPDLYVEGCPAFDTSGVRRPSPPDLVHVDVRELPEAVLEEVREKEGLSHRPFIAMAARRKPHGLPRWRITTDYQVWAVVETPLGCSAKPADERERREPVVRPKPARKKPEEAKAPVKETEPEPKKGAESPPEKPAGSLPVEGLMEIQSRAGLSALPAGLSIMRDPTSEVPRWRVELGDEIWWLTQKPTGGYVATPDGTTLPDQPAGEPKPGAKRRAAGRSPRDPEGVMRDIDVSELPQEALDAIQREAGSEKPPKVLFAAKRRGSGSPRWRIGTDMDIWRVSHSPHGWLARLSE